MKLSSINQWRALFAGVFMLAATTAAAAPFTLPLTYAPSGNLTLTGSVTFDDSLLAPNSDTGFDTLNGLDAVTLTATGPGIPGGVQTFTLADMGGWFVSTNNNGGFTDLNFFGIPNAQGCLLNGVQPFTVALVCGSTTVGVFRLDFSGPVVPVPALDSMGLVMLSLLLGAFALSRVARTRRH